MFKKRTPCRTPCRRNVDSFAAFFTFRTDGLRQNSGSDHPPFSAVQWCVVTYNKRRANLCDPSGRYECPAKNPHFVSAVIAPPVMAVLLDVFRVLRTSSSPEFDWTHSCRAPDHEHLGRMSLRLRSGRQAGRQSSDSGQTRKLRLVYFLPNDRTFNPDVVDSMKAQDSEDSGLFFLATRCSRTAKAP